MEIETSDILINENQCDSKTSNKYSCETFVNFNNLIGTISIEISILNTELKSKLKVFNKGCFKVLQKCEDGTFSIILKLSDCSAIDRLALDIYFSKSFTVKLGNDNVLAVNSNCDKLTLRYYTNKLLNIDNDYYVNPVKHYVNFNSDNENVLKSLKCYRCDYILSKKFPQDLKVFSNFNYDYKESMDILTCHEIHDIINIETQKLLKVVNLSDFKLCIYRNFLGDYNLDLPTIDYRCDNCGIVLGTCSNIAINDSSYSFVNFDIEMVIINLINESNYWRKNTTSHLNFILNYLIFEEAKTKSILLELVDSSNRTVPTEVYIEIKLIKKSIFYDHTIDALCSSGNCIKMKNLREGALFEWSVVRSQIIRVIREDKSLNMGLPIILRILDKDFYDHVNMLQALTKKTTYLTEKFDYLLNSIKRQLSLVNDCIYSAFLSHETSYFVKEIEEIKLK